MHRRFILILVLFLVVAFAAPATASVHSLSARQFVTQHAPWLLSPGRIPIPAPKAEGEDPDIGHTRTFWIWDLNVMPPTDREINTTLRGKGEHVLIYVDDVEWETTMTQAEVDEVLAAFEQATATTENSGIYENNINTFGEPSDIDGNGKLILLYYQVGEFNGYQFDGYFRLDDLGDGATSNHGDLIHLDVDHTSDDYGLGVAAHEFVHLIEFNYDQSEETWSSETAAEAAMHINGYLSDLVGVSNYFRNLDHALTGWIQGGYPAIDYNAIFLWAAFLLEDTPAGLFGNLIPNTLTGVDALLDTLGTMGDQRGFGTLMGDWTLMILLDDLDIPGQGFAGFDVPRLTKKNMPQAEAYALEIERQAIEFFKLEAPTEADATLIITADNERDVMLEMRAVALAADGETFQTAQQPRTGNSLELDLTGLPIEGLEIYLAVANPEEAVENFAISYSYGGDVTDGDTTDGDTTDGDVADGDTTDGDATDGDVADGDTTDGDATDGDVADGDVADGDVADGDVADGDTTDGDEPATDGDDVSDEDGSSGCQQAIGWPSALLLMLFAFGLIRRRKEHRV